MEGNISGFGKLNKLTKWLAWFCFRYFFTKGKYLQLTCVYFFVVKGAPRNLRITDETTDSFVVGWTPAPGNVLRYRLVYRPLTGGERRQVTVSANDRSTTLQNLIQDTRYEVSVVPEYQSGPGNSLNGYAKTDEGT